MNFLKLLRAYLALPHKWAVCEKEVYRSRIFNLMGMIFLASRRRFFSGLQVVIMTGDVTSRSFISNIPRTPAKIFMKLR